MLKLYSFWRSTASYRVRIALNLKELEHEIVSYNPVAAGDAARAAYRAVNPHGLVPTLADGASAIAQSLAIIEYLEERHPVPALLPAGPAARALARQIAQTIACEVHPLNNVAVLKYLEAEMGVDEQRRQAWYRHWVRRGLDAVESLLQQHGSQGAYALGAAPGLADCCIVPQLFNARWFKVPLDGWPRLIDIESACLALPAFDRARPEHQPDAPRASA
jgi:maleylacetoacetate isomerase